MARRSPSAPPPRRIALVPIGADAFAPFGTLLAAPDPAPRQDHAGALYTDRPDAAANLALIRSEPHGGLMPLVRLERHPHSSQTFLPLSVGAYVVVVAPDRGGGPDEAQLRAFRVPGDVGVTYRAGAWHAHMMTLDAPGTFAMLVFEAGTEADCVFAPIAPVIVVEAG